MSSKVLGILVARFGEAVLSTHSLCGDDTAVVHPTRLLEICRFLRHEDETSFDQPIDLTCVDFREVPAGGPEQSCFMVVYHLRSIKLGHRVRLKVPLPAVAPEVDSVTPVWKGFNWFEREVFDMFGVRFRNHPDLRRILMYPEFIGYPLRKDYPVRGYQPTMPMPTLETGPLSDRTEEE
jgi:NADH-quinone oxidoreductase subunit C